MKPAIRKATHSFDEKSSLSLDLRQWTQGIQSRFSSMPTEFKKAKISILEKELGEFIEMQSDYVYHVRRIMQAKIMQPKKMVAVCQNLLNIMVKVLEKLDIIQKSLNAIAAQIDQQGQELSKLKKEFIQWKEEAQQHQANYQQVIQQLQIVLVKNILSPPQPAQIATIPKAQEVVKEPKKEEPKINIQVKNIKGAGIIGDNPQGIVIVNGPVNVFYFGSSVKVEAPKIISPKKEVIPPHISPSPEPNIPYGYAVVYTSNINPYFIAEEKTTFALSLPGDYRVSSLVGNFSLSRAVFSPGVMPEPYHSGNGNVKIPPGWQLALVVGDNLREIKSNNQPVTVVGGANNRGRHPPVGIITRGATPPISRLEFGAAIQGHSLFRIRPGYHPVFVRAGNSAVLSEENKPVTAPIGGQGKVGRSPVGIMGSATSDSFPRLVLK